MANLNKYKQYLQSLEDEKNLSDEDKIAFGIFRQNMKIAKLEFSQSQRWITEEQAIKQLELIDKLCPDKRNFILCHQNPLSLNFIPA